MTKRNGGSFERQARDFYATPQEAVWKLMPHILDVTTFAEPMCGDGAIVRALETYGWECPVAYDIEPQGDMVGRAGTWDVLGLTAAEFDGCDAIISNPPWPHPPKMLNGNPKGYPAVPIIKHLMSIRPTWIILPADFCHNAYFMDLAENCPKMVSAGRVKWITDSTGNGFDNASWYLFDAYTFGDGPVFYGNRGNRNIEPVFHPSIGDLL